MFVHQADIMKETNVLGKNKHGKEMDLKTLKERMKVARSFLQRLRFLADEVCIDQLNCVYTICYDWI